MNMTRSTIKLKDKKYEIECIGKGGFADVYKAREIDKNGSYVAIKKITKKEKFLEKYRFRETDIHCKLDHPNIVQVYDVVTTKEAIYLILELCENGTLYDYVKKHNLNEKDVYLIFKQIVDGLKYLHSKQIIHRDLTLRNVLLTKDGTVKIADFGLSTRLNDKEESIFSVCGTDKYIAPEVRKGEGYKEKVDCWSLGCLLYGLLNQTNLPVGKKVSYPRHFSHEALELLQKLLEEKPTKRICIEEVEESEFFKKYERNSRLKNSLYKSGDSGNGSQNHLSSPLEKGSHFRSLDSGFNSKNSSSKKSKSNSKKNYSNEKLRERPNFDLQKDQLLLSQRHPWSREGIHDRKRSVSEDRKPYKSLNYNNPHLNRNSCERSASAERARLDVLKISHYSNDPCRIISSDDYKSEERYKNYDRGINSAGKVYRRFNPELTEHCVDPSCKFSNSLLEGQHNVCASTCSHAGCYNTKCSHVASCCCLSQSDHKQHLSNCNIPEKLNEHSLEQKTSPLNAARLRPKRYMPKDLNNVVLHISEDSQVIMEILKNKKRKIYVSEVFVVSTNGMEIKMYKPPKSVLLDDEHPPPFPKDSKEIKSYDYQKLPKMYHGRYLIAKQFVDILRAKKPKFINNGKNARFYVMENWPDPDMKMEFYDGGSVTKKGQKIIITNKFGREFVVVAPTKNLDQDFKSMLEEFLSEKEDCEALLKLIESHSRPLNYPVVFGEVKNDLKCPEQNTGKENYAPSSSKSNRRHKDR